MNPDERRVQFRVGVLVLATAIIAVLLVMLFADVPSLLRAGYQLTIQLPHAGGLREGAAVRRRGVLIGRVSEVRLAESGGVEIVVEIDAGVEIPRDEVPRLRVPMLGEAELDFVAPSLENRPQEVRPQAAAYSLPARRRSRAGRACCKSRTNASQSAKAGVRRKPESA